MEPAVALDVLILSEDSGKDGAAVLNAVVCKAIAHVYPGDTRRLRFTPADDAAAHWVHAARWKTAGKVGRGQAGQRQSDLLDLVRTIATWLRKSNPLAIVAFHYDGDTVWSRRAEGKTPGQYQTRILPKVKALLANPPPAPHSPNRQTPTALDETALELALARLIEVVPHYSMEAWLYLNAAELRRLATQDKVAADVHAKLEAWAAGPSALQEIPKVKDAGWPHDKHNLALAKNAWSASRAVEHSDSFADFVKKLSNLTDVRAALEAPAQPTATN